LLLIQLSSFVPNGTRDVFQPVPLDLLDQIKQQYSQGQDFFLLPRAIQPPQVLSSG